jgi:ABC-type nitrate/sulfonate/bicarbonate transport system substrate-binding protein
MCPITTNAAGYGDDDAARKHEPVSVIVFPGGFNWPIWAAQENGYFERNGITVTLTPTPNSVFQMTSLVDGKFDIAMTAIDNVVAYNENQGEAPTVSKPELIAFMGGDNGFLRLVTVPEVKTYADLKGRQLSVDALTTGYAFVLRKLLKENGLASADYELVKAGGVVERFESLCRKEHSGTLLISPFEVLAEAQGFNRLANAIDQLGHYQGVVGATRRVWAKQHERELVAYIRGYLTGLDWLFEPTNKNQAILLLRSKLPNMSEHLASKSYDILLDPQNGFSRKAELNLEGVRAVLSLRSEYGNPRKYLSDPSKYLELRYYEMARAAN